MSKLVTEHVVEQLSNGEWLVTDYAVEQLCNGEWVVNRRFASRKLCEEAFVKLPATGLLCRMAAYTAKVPALYEYTICVDRIATSSIEFKVRAADGDTAQALALDLAHNADYSGRTSTSEYAAELFRQEEICASCGHLLQAVTVDLDGIQLDEQLRCVNHECDIHTGGVNE